jgi:serine/threonine protein kinase
VLEAVATDPVATKPSRGRTPPPTVEEVAAHFTELEVLELIGAGGMGAVYKARQPKLDRFVALKILSSDLAEDPAFADGRYAGKLHLRPVPQWQQGIACYGGYLYITADDGNADSR